jgi:hypothetical protein
MARYMWWGGDIGVVVVILTGDHSTAGEGRPNDHVCNTIHKTPAFTKHHSQNTIVRHMAGMGLKPYPPMFQTTTRSHGCAFDIVNV